MSKRLVAIAALGLLIGAISGVVLMPEVRHRLGSLGGMSTPGKVQVGGPFELVDHHGKTRTEKDFAGRFMLVFFGFTSCPDICPSGLQVISAALDQLGPKADRITALFVSVDPARDTPAKLADYLSSFGGRILGLTGSEEAVAAAVRAYRVYAKKVVDPNRPGEYTYDHTSIIYIMDKKGEYVGHTSHATGLDKLVAQLERVL